MGIKSTYTQEIADEICQRLAGGESLRTICKDAHLPNRATVHRWLIDNLHGFCDQYTRARDIGLDELADEMLEIADTTEQGVRREDSEEGYKEVREDMLGHRKLRVDARKWYLSKLAPKKYGDRIATELTGADGGPVQITDTERAAKINAILAVAQARQSGESVDDLV